MCVPAWLQLVDRTYFVSTAEERLLNLVPINTFSRGHPEGPEALSARCATVETEVITFVCVWVCIMCACLSASPCVRENDIQMGFKF